MDNLSAWRTALPESFRLFGALLEQDTSLSVPYGVVAGALLWAVRQDGSSPSLRETLVTICGTEDIAPLAGAVDMVRSSQPLAGAQALSRTARDDAALRSQLDRLLEFFREDCLRYQMLKPATSTIEVAGNVEGANIVLGGVQYVAGDLVISQMLVQHKVRPCPTSPNPPPHFAGRRGELEQLEATLRQGRNVAITGIQGMGGIGKTALALQLAAESRAFGAVLWASLGPDPAVVNHLLSWARHGDPSFEAGDSPLDVLASRVQATLTDLVRERCPGRVLVLLDDVWEGSSVAAARLLQRAAPPDSVQVLTTRSQLVVAQLRSTRLELRPLRPADSLQMLRNLLPAHPRIVDEELLALAEVLGHHPLALELAAGQVQLLERPEAEIGGLIEDYRGGIPAGSPFRDLRLELGEAREDNLEVVLSFSYASLDEPDRARFRALGILAYGAPFDQALCRSVWQTEPKLVLDRLRHRALLAIGSDPGWYQQHQLLRAYARALLSRDPRDRDQAAGRYAECVVGITEQFGTIPLTGWAALEAYVPHVVEVGADLTAATRDQLGEPDADDRLLRRALSFSLNTRRLLANRRELEHADWLAMGLAISRQRMDLGYVVLFHNELGEDLFFRGDMQKTIRHLHQAQQIAETADDRRGLARTCANLGRFFLLSDPGEAPDYLRRAIRLYEQLDDAPGLTTSLLRLAEWHADRYHSFDEREHGVVVLQRAHAVAGEAGYDEGLAEATLGWGRLHDTLGRRDEAITLLSQAVEQFRRLGQRDREGVAYLFLASAEANAGRLQDAEADLLKALPLLRSTGHASGQATVLRNLGELYADQGRGEQALAQFAQALPLVRKQTMRFLDEDDEEASTAPCRFFAQLEEVAKFDLVEQFRERALEQIPDDGAGSVERPSAEAEDRGLMPDEVLKYLVTETIRVNTTQPQARRPWTVALQGFMRRLTDRGQRHQADVGFAGALLDLTLGRAPALPEASPYASYLQPLVARIEHGRRSPDAPLLSDEELRQATGNTIAVRLFQPEHRHEWSVHLRKQRRNAWQWGDDDERELYEALLAVLDDRLITLPERSPYYPHFRRLLDELAMHQTPLVDSLLERTVAVRTVAIGRRLDWLDSLRQVANEACRHGQGDELAFVQALVALVDDRLAVLPGSNPYRPALERAAAAIAQRRPLPVPPPPGVLADLWRRVVAARTSEPKTVDQLVEDMVGMAEDARGLGRYDELALYGALFGLLEGRKPKLPTGNPYRSYVQQIMEEIGRSSAKAAPTATIPQAQIDSLVDPVVAARTNAPELHSEAGQRLLAYHSRLERRGADWDGERAFTAALLALLEGRPVALPPGNPYTPVVQRAHDHITRSNALRAEGANLTADQLADLLETTASYRRRLSDATAAGMDQLQGGGDLVELLQATHGIAMELNDWKEALVRMREEADARGADWAHEAALLDALVGVVDEQPASLSAGNPYRAAFQSMLQEIGYQSGLPKGLQVSALASDSPEEHAERFREVVTGEAAFAQELDLMLMNTVIARTTGPDFTEQWMASLERACGQLLSRDDDFGADFRSRAVELLRALQGLLRGERPTLPVDHSYATHLRRVVASIDLFHAPLPSPGSLSGEQISRCSVMTAGALTIGHEHFDAWRDELGWLRGQFVDKGATGEETLAFLDALLIVLEQRPADLPLENRYRPYLQLTQHQIRALQRAEDHGPAGSS